VQITPKKMFEECPVVPSLAREPCDQSRKGGILHSAFTRYFPSLLMLVFASCALATAEGENFDETKTARESRKSAVGFD
jgi:hypothetical protein